MHYTLESLGFHSFFTGQVQLSMQPGLTIGRIAVEHKNNYLVYTENGTTTAEASGKLLYMAQSAAELPKVGDFVLLALFDQEEKGIIVEVLNRKTVFSRKAAGKQTQEQIIAVNIDLLFIVQALDDNFNLRRLERYLVMAYESGASPVIILNKADICANVQAKLQAVQKLAAKVPVVAISCHTHQGLEQLTPFMQAGTTIAFAGSSGVGKSTIINLLLGEERQKTGIVRSVDSKGKHTTTHRELFLLPNGAILIDTPGMREIALWQADEGLDTTFADITGLAGMCYYSDCTHTTEKKCAVLQALSDGTISSERLASYHKLQKELAHLHRQEDKNSFLAHKHAVKKIHKQYKQTIRNKHK